MSGLRHAPASNDWTIRWIRRARLAANWLPSIEVPLGEVSESYQVDIVSTVTELVVRTLTSSTNEVTYTAAQQTTDLGGAATTLKVRVYQISASVGRGWPAEKTV